MLLIIRLMVSQCWHPYCVDCPTVHRCHWGMAYKFWWKLECFFSDLPILSSNTPWLLTLFLHICLYSQFGAFLLCPYFASAFHFVRMAFFHFVVMYGTLWSLTPIVLTSACLPTLFFINVFQWKNWSSTSLKIPLMCQGVRDNSWLQKVSWACLILSYAENESVIT